jgi:hypothetical protein
MTLGLIALFLFSCNKVTDSETPDSWNAQCSVIKSFYDAYSKRNYKEMNRYLNDEMRAFYKQWRKGAPMETIKSIDKDSSVSKDGKLWICVRLKVETTPLSSQYPSTESTEFLSVEKQGGEWLITEMRTSP